MNKQLPQTREQLEKEIKQIPFYRLADLRGHTTEQLEKIWEKHHKSKLIKN